MGRPYHGRRRRKPRTRRRYRGGGLPRSGSFQAFGMKYLYDLLLPGVRGRARRQFFNRMCAPVALVYGVFGAMVGGGMAGPLGAIIGFGAVFSLASEFLVRDRFYRA